MTDNIENLILEHLRAMRPSIDRIESDVREIKNRLTHLEQSVPGAGGELALGEKGLRLGGLKHTRMQLAVDFHAPMVDNDLLGS